MLDALPTANRASHINDDKTDSISRKVNIKKTLVPTVVPLSGEPAQIRELLSLRDLTSMAVAKCVSN